MGQKTTYSVPRETEADRIAAKERAKEKARMARAAELASMETVVHAEVLKVAAEIVAERDSNGAPIDTAKLEARAEAKRVQRAEDEALYEHKIARREQLVRNFYSFAKSATNAYLEFVELSADLAPLCKRLGKSNPVRTSVMGISDGTGIITDPVRHTDEVWKKFIRLYRVESGQIDLEKWERLP